MPETIAQALAEYAEEVGKQPAADIRRYFEWCGTEGRDLDGYLRHLVKAGKARGTADKVRREVQAFFRHFDLPAPKVRGWRFDGRREGKHEDLTPAAVAAMVAAARDRLPPHLRAMLCLATLYGYRTGEIAAVGPADIDLPGQRIFGRTQKGGRRAWQWLPPEAAPHLRLWQGPQDPSRVQAAWSHVWASASDQPKPAHLGWHAVRRSLVVQLLAAGAPHAAVGHFLRWSDGGARDGMSRMVDLYGAPSGTVGTDGQVSAPEADAGRREDDPEIWSRHPFLSHWA